MTLDRTTLLAKHDAATGELLWQRLLGDPSWERSDLLGRPAEAPDGSIHVPDAGRGFVVVVAADGSRQTVFGSAGAKRGELAFPVGVAFAPGGLILVLDQMKHTVLLFDADHQFVNEVGGVGERPGELYNPVGIAGGPDGRVYVSQGFQGRVQVFRLAEGE